MLIALIYLHPEYICLDARRDADLAKCLGYDISAYLLIIKTFLEDVDDIMLEII